MLNVWYARDNRDALIDGGILGQVEEERFKARFSGGVGGFIKFVGWAVGDSRLAPVTWAPPLATPQVQI